MRNKNFHGWLNKNNNKNLINNFLKSLDDLKNIKDVKLNTTVDDIRNNHYYNFIHEILSYKNLIYFRIYDLASSLLPTIESKNYTTAVIICRAMFETNVMFVFRAFRLSDRIRLKKWGDLYIEILNFKMLPSWKEEGDIDWGKAFPALKKFHINDGIKLAAKSGRNNKESKSIEKLLFKYYGKMSEISHPTQANRQLYVYDRDKFDLEKMHNKKIFRDNFSVNHADDTVFPIFENTLKGFIGLDEMASEIINTCIDDLKKNKDEVLKYTLSSKGKDDILNTQPVLKIVKKLIDEGCSPTKIVDEVIKSCYTKNRD